MISVHRTAKVANGEGGILRSARKKRATISCVKRPDDNADNVSASINGFVEYGRFLGSIKVGARQLAMLHLYNDTGNRYDPFSGIPVLHLIDRYAVVPLTSIKKRVMMVPDYKDTTQCMVNIYTRH